MYVTLWPNFPGTAVSVETTHDLLDLICLYSDKDPVQDGEPQVEDTVSHLTAEPQGPQTNYIMEKYKLDH